MAHSFKCLILVGDSVSLLNTNRNYHSVSGAVGGNPPSSFKIVLSSALPLKKNLDSFERGYSYVAYCKDLELF